MIEATKVSDYILKLSKTQDFEGDAITHLKIQKLLYYVQGLHLAVYGKALFPESIEAWDHGPVVPEIYSMYKGYKNKPLPDPEKSHYGLFTKEQRDLIRDVYSVYGQFSAWKLRNMTHD